ncbi:MAG TPA: sterol desaturase family protein [Mycobacteriales bacterium]|jgi:hypothetical protein|nr:sterol desaturase family protein [Mycobacteriales bacterium]
MGRSVTKHPKTYADAGEVAGLAGWAEVFFRRRGPQLLAGAAAVAVPARLAMGRWRRDDAIVAGAIVGLHPFAEWAVHVYLLHRPPRVRHGQVRESYVARTHRSHHQDPTDIDLVLLPLRTVVGLVAVNAVLPIVGRDRRRATTGAATSLVMLLGYEWVHFLIHSPHQPRTALYRARWRGHRLHHFRNERYWFGVVATVADKVLGTAPDRDGVPVSPTARTLHPVSVA